MRFKDFLTNSIKTATRSLKRNKTYSLINIIGISISIASFLYITMFISYEQSFDKFHENSDRIFRIRYKVYRNGELNLQSAASVPRIGPFMKEVMPQVDNFVRLFPFKADIEYKEKVFREDRLFYADPSFLRIFSFNLKEGDPQGFLKKANEVVVTESIARKYFDNESPIGKSIKLNGSELLKVSGVIQDPPKNSHFHFDFLVSYETLNNQTRRGNGVTASEMDWSWYSFYTYVLLKPGTNEEEFNSTLSEAINNELGQLFDTNNYVQEFTLQSIEDIHLKSNLTKELEPQSQGDTQSILILSIVAFLIILIAWGNHINISTARAFERIKEVRIRKINGAKRLSLFLHFVVEAFIVNLLALFIGVVTFCLGVVKTGITNEDFFNNSLTSSKFLLIYIALLIIGTLISGWYPAALASSFRPSQKLANEFSSKGKVTMRRILILIQIIFSTASVASTIVLYKQFELINQVDLGFDKQNKFVIYSPQSNRDRELFTTSIKTFKESVKSYQVIENVSSSTNIPGKEIIWSRVIKKAEDPDNHYQSIYQLGVDHSFFETYKIEIIAGRNYDESINENSSLILNKTAVTYIGFDSPESAINEKVSISGNIFNVIGVVSDHHQLSIKSEVIPLVFPLAEGIGRYLTVKYKNNNFDLAMNEARKTFHSIFPSSPFETFNLENSYNLQYQKEKTFSIVFLVFSLIAIIVATFGLYGLSYFSTIKRTKEIGIRKTVGAPASHLIFLLLKEYVILIIIGCGIAFPLVQINLSKWLDNFIYRTSIGLEVFILSFITVLFFVLIAVSYQTLKAIRIDPVETLRYD